MQLHLKTRLAEKRLTRKIMMKPPSNSLRCKHIISKGGQYLLNCLRDMFDI